MLIKFLNFGTIFPAGFICPVHTPDGVPCGLLNHLTKDCQVTDAPEQALLKNLPSVLYELGVLPLGTIKKNYNCYDVLLDGKVIGFTPFQNATDIVKSLRILKVEGNKVKLNSSL